MNNRNPPQSISLTDLSEYLMEDSSFAFEMRVREIFASKDLRFKHGGTYADPHTGLPRQFDLQTEFHCRLWKSPLSLYLAVECKSLSEYAPMLVYRSPRSVEEAGHQLIATTCGDRNKILRALKVDPPNYSLQSQTGPFPSICTLDVSPRASRYPSDEAVGKAVRRHVTQPRPDSQSPQGTGHGEQQRQSQHHEQEIVTHRHGAPARRRTVAAGRASSRPN
jgi:hypothetical protein